MRNQSKKEEKEKDQTQIKSSAGDKIGNVKVEIKEEADILSCDNDSPERRAELFSPRREVVEIVTRVRKTFTCDKCNKEYDRLNSLQLHKESVHGNPNREKRVLGPSKALGLMRRTVVLQKEAPERLAPRLTQTPTSTSTPTQRLIPRPPSNPSPWHALLSQAARHFRTEDAETIRKIRTKLPPAK